MFPSESKTFNTSVIDGGPILILLNFSNADPRKSASEKPITPDCTCPVAFTAKCVVAPVSASKRAATYSESALLNITSSVKIKLPTPEEKEAPLRTVGKYEVSGAVPSAFDGTTTNKDITP